MARVGWLLLVLRGFERCPPWPLCATHHDRRHLFVDEGRGVLFIGPHELDAASLAPTGRRRTYTNPSGRMASAADLDAFAAD